MCHVLIIEDDFLAADYLAALAEMSGATSHSIAATEERAVALAASKHPALLLSAIRLREGCGRQAVSRIIESIGPVGVLFVTGHPGDCDSGPNSPVVLAKPFLRDEFIATFRRLVPSPC